ncbi:MAG TPA: HNH endonuclease, partial [Myxococcales bacterium]|nr:HNH endonuclease [Myxococcales bacterium]
SVGGACYDQFVTAAGPRREISFDDRFEALASVAAMLPWPLPRRLGLAEHRELVRLTDAVYVGVARGKGALDVALGDDLDEMSKGDRVLQLGFSSVGDYSRERHDIAASSAQKMMRRARELRDRPLLRAAVRAGEVRVRHADAVLPLARGEAEAYWVARARTQTVRALEKAVKGRSTEEPDDDEERVCVRLDIRPELRPIVDEAMELGRHVLRATEPEGSRAAGMCEEYLGAHPPPEGAEEAVRLLTAPASEFEDPKKEWLEQDNAQWISLGEPDPVAAPEPLGETGITAHRLDERIRERAKMRRRWDRLLGRVGMIFRALKGWEVLDFVSFEHYCTERLGMSAQAVTQRAKLEEKLQELPALRRALRDGRLSYEKARLIARCVDEESMKGWIERAQKMTCIQLRRQLQKKEEAQMCARGELAIWVPRRLLGLFPLAFAAARKAEGRSLTPGECFARIAEHFIDVWKPMITLPDGVRRAVLERDNWLCQVPWCSRAADHVHHILFRSAGGTDDPSNLVSLCAAHHLHGVHKGYLRVSGKAPDGLRWEVRTPSWGSGTAPARRAA